MVEREGGREGRGGGARDVSLEAEEEVEEEGEEEEEEEQDKEKEEEEEVPPQRCRSPMASNALKALPSPSGVIPPSRLPSSTTAG